MGVGPFFETIATGIDALNEWVGRLVSWVVVFLVAVVFIDVLMRYAVNTSFVFIQELEWHLFGFIFLMGAGYTLLYDQHVRVDVLYQRLSDKGQAWVNVLGGGIFSASRHITDYLYIRGVCMGISHPAGREPGSWWYSIPVHYKIMYSCRIFLSVIAGHIHDHSQLANPVEAKREESQ